MSDRTMTCGDITAKPGERKYGYLHVGYMAANTECRIPLQILNGAKDGPVLCLESTLHGWEPVGAEIIRRALQRVDPADLSGTVLALPLAHPFAVEFGGNIEGAGLRTNPSDNLDMNRVWPGKSLYEEIWHLPDMFPKFGAQGTAPWCCQVELVIRVARAVLSTMASDIILSVGRGISFGGVFFA